MELTQAVDRAGFGDDDLPALRASAQRSMDLISDARSKLAPTIEGVDVVACGSLGRREFTAESDIDHLVLVTRLVDYNQVQKIFVNANEWATEHGGKPGDSGLFGRALGAYDLMTDVGLQDDTNHSLTRRMLLLMESVSLSNNDVHATIMEAIVKRYLDIGNNPGNPPRFLINDILRYWRTIAVDYQAKLSGGPSAKTVLRHLKLRITRKALIASSLLPLMRCAELGSSDHTSYLCDAFTSPPLARLVSATSDYPEDVRSQVRRVLTCVDAYLAVAGTSHQRNHLTELQWGERENDELYNALKDTADDLQRALEKIYMSDQMIDLTRKYLLF